MRRSDVTWSLVVLLCVTFVTFVTSESDYYDDDEDQNLCYYEDKGDWTRCNPETRTQVMQQVLVAGGSTCAKQKTINRKCVPEPDKPKPKNPKVPLIKPTTPKIEVTPTTPKKIGVKLPTTRKIEIKPQITRKIEVKPPTTVLSPTLKEKLPKTVKPKRPYWTKQKPSRVQKPKDGPREATQGIPDPNKADPTSSKLQPTTVPAAARPPPPPPKFPLKHQLKPLRPPPQKTPRNIFRHRPVFLKGKPVTVFPKHTTPSPLMSSKMPLKQFYRPPRGHPEFGHGHPGFPPPGHPGFPPPGHPGFPPPGHPGFPPPFPPPGHPGFPPPGHHGFPPPGHPRHDHRPRPGRPFPEGRRNAWRPTTSLPST